MEKLKELALAHFEKAVLGVCAVLLLWFLADALRTPVYKKQPEDFVKATQAAKKNLDGTNGIPDEQTKEFEAGDVVAMAKNLYRPFDPKDVQDLHHTQRWQRPFDLGVNFRNRPDLLAPGKLMVQQNRGLMSVYLVNENGERVTRKVPKSKVRHVVAKADPRFESAGKMAGKMAKMGGSGDLRMGGGRANKMAPKGAGGGGGGAEGYPGGGGMNESMQRGMMSSSMGRSASGYGGPGEDGGGGLADDGAAMPGTSGDGAAAVEPEFLEARKSAAAEDPKKKKDDPLVDEPVLARQGFRWVEIVAPFPHEEQIVKYVEALNEGAATVPLYYAYADVQRATLGSGGQWSEFVAIDAVKMYNVVNNALQFQNERSAACVQGLSMGIPALNPVQRKFLHQDLDFYLHPKKAEYELRHLDPLGWEFRKENERKAALLRDPNAPQDDKKAEAESKNKKVELDERNVGRLNGPGNAAKGIDARKGESNRATLKTALARFWDFTVETGATYKYRMRVKVFNPNYKRTDVYDNELAARTLLDGPWSEVSEPVTVDPDAFWYVADAADPASKSLNKGSALGLPALGLEVHRWDTAMGQWMVQAMTQRPGQVVGVVAQKKNVEKAVWNHDKGAYEFASVPLDNQFSAGQVVLNLEGGPGRKQTVQAMGRTFAVLPPRTGVAIDADGQVHRHHDLADAENEVRQAIVGAYRKLQTKIAELKPEGAGEDLPKESAKPARPPKGAAKGPAKGGGGNAAQ